MTTKTTTKRHRWPKHDRPGDCRSGDTCLDCGALLNDVKAGGVPCEPVDGYDGPPFEATEFEIAGYQESLAHNRVISGFYDDHDLELLGITKDEAESTYRTRSLHSIAEYVLSFEPRHRRQFIRDLGDMIVRSAPSTPGRWVEMHLTAGPCLKGWLFETDEDES
jgi:hypothetical protein